MTDDLDPSTLPHPGFVTPLLDHLDALLLFPPTADGEPE